LKSKIVCPNTSYPFFHNYFKYSHSNKFDVKLTNLLKVAEGVQWLIGVVGPKGTTGAWNEKMSPILFESRWLKNSENSKLSCYKLIFLIVSIVALYV